MKNIIFKVFIASLLLSSFTSIGQTKDDYINGYKEGFRAGYCQNESPCSAPIPNSQSISIGDRPLQYPAGYAQGLNDGKEKRTNEEKTKSTTTNIKENNKSNESDPIISNFIKRREATRNQYNSSTKSRSRNHTNFYHTGWGVGAAYDVGLSGSFDVFLDTWMFGLGYGSRVLEDNSNVYATEEKIFATLGLKITNGIFVKGGFGTYYDLFDDYCFLSCDFSGPDYYEIYNNNGSSYFQLGIQAFIPSGSSAFTPEIFYSNLSGSVGFGIGIIF